MIQPVHSFDLSRDTGVRSEAGFPSRGPLSTIAVGTGFETSSVEAGDQARLP